MKFRLYMYCTLPVNRSTAQVEILCQRDVGESGKLTQCIFVLNFLSIHTLDEKSASKS